MTVKGLRIQVNPAGAGEVLRSAAVVADVQRRADAIAAAAGDGIEVVVTRNRDRAVVFVRTKTSAAMKAEAVDRSLTRAINAGR